LVLRRRRHLGERAERRVRDRVVLDLRAAVASAAHVGHSGEGVGHLLPLQQRASHRGATGFRGGHGTTSSSFSMRVDEIQAPVSPGPGRANRSLLLLMFDEEAAWISTGATFFAGADEGVPRRAGTERVARRRRTSAASLGSADRWGRER